MIAQEEVSGKSRERVWKKLSTILRRKTGVFGPKSQRKGGSISATFISSFSEITTCLSAKLELSTGQIVLISRAYCTKEAAVAELIGSNFQHKSLTLKALCRKVHRFKKSTFEGKKRISAPKTALSKKVFNRAKKR
ncbi:MAG: hypothetical protein IJV69_02835 [Kiritimatiellae bacterium]|nr:hypothetical protein [Kiritimatiellia bacterium]